MIFLVFALITSIPINFAADNEKQTELVKYTSLFALEILSCGLGTHLIKGKHFDIPASDQQVIAVAAARTWWTLPYMKRVSDIVRRVGQSTAEEYIESSYRMSGRIYKYMFEKVEWKLKLEPEINKIYNLEKKNVSESTNLQKLHSGIIDIEDSKNADKKLQDAFISDFNLRIILINTIFQQYGFAKALKDNKTDIYVMARAIVQLSKKTEFTERVNCIYRRAVRELIHSKGETLYKHSGGAVLVNTELFPILIRSFKNEPMLDAELTVIKENFSRDGLPAKNDRTLK